MQSYLTPDEYETVSGLAETTLVLDRKDELNPAAGVHRLWVDIGKLQSGLMEAVNKL